MELMHVVDETITEPVRDLDKDFFMPIEDVFSISGHWMAVTGHVEQGKAYVGYELQNKF